MMNHEKYFGLDLPRRVIALRRLSHHVWKHFQEDRCLEEAASLSYTSLLAMVPLLAVIFGVISIFPVFSEISSNLQQFIFSNFMPATGEQIEPFLNTFLESVSGLTLPGTIMLIITALLLMFRIEHALNRIWRVNQQRTLTNRIVMYWAVLTLGPIMIGAAIALSAQKVLLTLGLEDGLQHSWHRAGIFFLSWMVFTMFFVLVPNRQVKFKDALAGAFLSGVLIELAKWGFVVYVKNANYSEIYGTLATIPIFLFWLYIVWAVILFGASLAASLTTFSEKARQGDWPVKWEFQLLYRVVGHLWQAQKEGQSVTMSRLMELEARASEHQILKALHHLSESKIVTFDHEDAWMLTRDLQDISLGELYQSSHYYLPVAEKIYPPDNGPWDGVLVQSLATMHGNLESVLNRSLRDMYQQSMEQDKK